MATFTLYLDGFANFHGDVLGSYRRAPSLKQTVKAPENGAETNRNPLFQRSMFRCELLVLLKVSLSQLNDINWCFNPRDEPGVPALSNSFASPKFKGRSLVAFLRMLRGNRKHLVIVSPQTWGCGTPSKWPFTSWLINGGDPNHLRYLG